MKATHGTELFLSLREGVRLKRPADARLILEHGGRGIEFEDLSEGASAALELLAKRGGVEDELLRALLERDGAATPLSNFYYYLERLSAAGLLLRSIRLAGQPLATLEPLSPYFKFEHKLIDPQQRFRLSRFAFVRVERGELLLESPLSHARVLLHDRRASLLVHELARPLSLIELRARFDHLPQAETCALVRLWANARMLASVDENGDSDEDTNPVMRTWEFHDLLFHSRSRKGRHNNPTGSTYRFARQLAPPPALKSTPAGRVIELPRPDLRRLTQSDPPFASVQEARRSIREYGGVLISRDQLGEFLYRTGRVIERREIERPTPQGNILMEFARRPYPGSGALHELELYVAVNACRNLSRGLYFYDPVRHSLVEIETRREDVEKLLSETGKAAGLRPENVQVVVLISARFQRLSWKYASMAYAVLLKNVGVLYETMYLAATASGLAPCAVGCGDSDLFARAIKSDYYEETSVGEFLLGGKPS